jgi:DNA primase small subunit
MIDDETLNNIAVDIEDFALTTTSNNTKTSIPVKKEEPKPSILLTKDNLELYYQNIFPFRHFFKWLGLEQSSLFERREFSYQLEGDIIVRFQSYKNDEEFKKECLRGLPHKIDIGAVFNTLPKYHNSVMNSDSKGFLPEQKEMVFDIDMTDYDDIRTCCSDAKICNKCWCFMIVAYKILNEILKEDFGFEHIMWIFSGRRGIHCWISDENAKKLQNDGRSAVCNFIKIKFANTRTGVSSIIREPLHPSLE